MSWTFIFLKHDNLTKSIFCFMYFVQDHTSLKVSYNKSKDIFIPKTATDYPFSAIYRYVSRLKTNLFRLP